MTKTLESKSIPTPKLIIKDHKNANKDDDFPSRLIVPANNFTSSFPLLGYLGTKRIFDSEKIHYEERMITQDLKLKEDIEIIKLKKKRSTVSKLRYRGDMSINTVFNC